MNVTKAINKTNGNYKSSINEKDSNCQKNTDISLSSGRPICNYANYYET